MKYSKKTLFIVDWDDNRETQERWNPRVVSVEADESEKSFIMRPDRMNAAQRDAFGSTLVPKEGKSGRLAKNIGFSAVEAVHLALESLKVDEAYIERVRISIQREMTDLAVLGLSEAGA